MRSLHWTLDITNIQHSFYCIGQINNFTISSHRDSVILLNRERQNAQVNFSDIIIIEVSYTSHNLYNTKKKINLKNVFIV